jgi:hypothetical protein
VRTLIRAALASLVSFALLVGPVSAATNQATTVAQATQTGTITGQVTSDSGGGVSGAAVSIEGSGQHQTATTDDSGNFTSSVPAGIYTVTVNKGGYQTGSTQVTVAPGTSVSLTVGLTTASLNNLGVIGRTSTNISGNAARFNISSTPTQTLTQQQILQRNTPDLTEVVNELPGVTIPHATSNPNEGFIIRGLRYETKVDLDGHPVSSGTLGFFVTNYASSAIFGGVDIVKGAGLNGPTAAESGAGTVNLHTPDFTAQNSGFFQIGGDSYHGSIYTALVDLNFLKNNKLSFIFGRTFSGYRGPTYGLQEPDGSGPSATTLLPTVGTFMPPPNITNALIPYVQDFSNTYSLNAELAKMRYKFSDATSLSLEFLGLQGRFDPQGGAYGQFEGYATIPLCKNGAVSGFTPAACNNQSSYNSPGSTYLIGQSNVPLYAFFPGSFVRQNNPNFNADFKTTIGNDTLLFRPYTAAINRLIDGTQENQVPGDNGVWNQVTSTANCQATYTAPSVANGGAQGPCFGANQAPIAAYINGSGVPQPSVVYATTPNAPVCTVTTPCFTTPTGVNNSGQLGYGSPFTTLEIDKLMGYTFSYIHPVGANTFNVSFDHYYDDTTDLINDASPLLPGCSFVINTIANTPGQAGFQPNCPLATLRPSPVSVPETFSSVSSLALTGQFQITPKIEFDAGAYFTHYVINAQQENPAILAALTPSFAAPTPAFPTGRTNAIPVVFSGVQNSASHFDPHFGLTYRPTRDWVVRFTGGSSLSIPYASLVSGLVVYNQGSTSTTETLPNFGLLPEEVVSLDLGSDFRTPDGTVLSGDIYNTVVHNPWISTKTLVCNCTLPGLEPTAQTFSSQTLNGPQQYAQGIEFSITNEPKVGWGYRINSSFERLYYLDIPNSFFSGCTVAQINSCSEPFYNGAQYASTGSNITSVPYAKGYAELQYATANKSLFRIGMDYEGSNNSYNAPAFVVFDAGARINTGFHDVMFGATVEGLSPTNFYALYAKGVEFQGLAPLSAVPTTTGYAYTNQEFSTALVSPGPITVRFTLTKQF